MKPEYSPTLAKSAAYVIALLSFAMYFAVRAFLDLLTFIDYRTAISLFLILFNLALAGIFIFISAYIIDKIIWESRHGIR